MGAENGLEGLEKLAEKDYDIVLMDVQMPEMDGFTATKIIRQIENNAASTTTPLIDPQLAQKLRKRLWNRHQIIIALTAHAMREDKDKCMASGMNDYLTKPFVPEQLDITLKKYSGKRL